MDETSGISARDRRRRERVIWRAGLGVSLLLHAALFLMWRGPVIPTTSLAAAGPDRGNTRPAAGAMQALNLRAAPETPVAPPPVPVEVEVAVEPLEIEETAEVDPASLLGDRPGLEEAPGVDEGTGTGDRGSSDRGLNEVRPPSPRGMIMPPTNRDLRGTEVQVWVFVNAAGRVVPDSTRLDPPTRDGDFNRRLIREAAEWVFEPAMRAGSPVGAWFPYRIIM